MTLLEIRTKFAEVSGRYDLVNPTTFADAGADFYISAGQRYLDRKFNNLKSYARIFDEVAAGVYYITFQTCRAIQEVWVNNTEERWQLKFKDLIQIRKDYTELVSSTDQGSPEFYSPAMLRAIDSTDMNSLGTFFNYILADSDDYNGIVFLPAPDEALVVEVHGLWYSDALSVDADESYWSLNNPEMLVQAALLQLEIMYRNTEGVKDWTAAVSLGTIDLDKDQVEQEILGVDDMEG